jgi:hypothetical protein
MNSQLTLELMERAVAGLTGERAVVSRGYGDKYVAVWGLGSAEFDQSWAILSLDEFEMRFAATFLAKKGGAPDTAALRTKVLRLAQYLADGERPTARDLSCPFADLIATIYAAPSISPVQAALIAVEMSRHI